MGRFTYRGERSIKVVQGIINKAKEKLRKHYRDIELGTPAEIELKIEKTIDKALWGWPNASKEFSVRIVQLLGPNSKAVKRRLMKKLKYKNDKKIKDPELSKFDEYLIKNNVHLSDEEKTYMAERYYTYKEDFEFNQSSDRALLDTIVVDEIIMKRLEVNRLSRISLDDDLEKLTKDISERYRRNLDALGVSRKQRVEYDQNIEGNVSQLSINVEEKLVKIKEVSDEKKKKKLIDEVIAEQVSVDKEELLDLIKEIEYKRKHDMFPEKNYVSEAELLGSDSSNGASV